jgi:hypothetical protein
MSFEAQLAVVLMADDWVSLDQQMYHVRDDDFGSYRCC